MNRSICFIIIFLFSGFSPNLYATEKIEGAFGVKLGEKLKTRLIDSSDPIRAEAIASKDSLVIELPIKPKSIFHPYAIVTMTGKLSDPNLSHLSEVLVTLSLIPKNKHISYTEGEVKKLTILKMLTNKYGEPPLTISGDKANEFLGADNSDSIREVYMWQNNNNQIIFSASTNPKHSLYYYFVKYQAMNLLMMLDTINKQSIKDNL